MHCIQRFISFLLFGLVLANPAIATATAQAAQTEAQNVSVYEQIKEIYLPAIGMVADEEKPSAVQQQQSAASWFLFGKKEEKPKPELAINPMSPAEKKTMAFDLLARHDNTQPSNFLSEHSWDDLELFKQANLLKTINRTHTSFGEAVLGKMLVIGGDVAVAMARQTAIKELVTDAAEHARINAALTQAGTAEEVYLLNFKNEDPAYEEYFAKLYFGAWTSKLFSNENPWLLEAKTRWNSLSNAVGLAGASMTVLVPIATIITAIKLGALKKAPKGSTIARFLVACDLANEWYERKGKKMMDDLSFEEQAELGIEAAKAATLPEAETYHRAKRVPSYSWMRGCFMPYIMYSEKNLYDKINNDAAKKELNNFEKNRIKATNYIIGCYGALTLFIWASLAKPAYEDAKYQFEALNYLQSKLIPLGTVIRALDNVRSQITHSAALRNAMPLELKKLHKAFGSGNQKFDELVRLLNTDTFTGSSTMLSLQGRVLTAHKLMQEVKYELRDAFEALGTIDALASMATLVKEYEGQDNKYCFVNFTNESQPHLKAVNFWNPLVTTKKPVPNTVELGAVGKNRNMILTGQNTAGKSTTLRSLLQGVLLAHVFGVAPCESMELTPFKLIRTHINIKDDVEHGISHFKAEVINIDEIQKSILSLKPGERCFVVIDEIFHTTGPQTAVPLARKYFLGLANYADVMVISSTHFPELIELEKETNGVYKNYKMEILKIDGKLVRPHKIEEGSTTANVAEDILAEQGITLFS